MITQHVMEQLQRDLGRDALAFLPELILCGGIVLLLVLRLFRTFDRLHMGWTALAVSLVALTAAYGQWQGLWGLPEPKGAVPIFTGLLVYDSFTVFLRLLLLFIAVLVVWLSQTTGIPDREDSADFHVLLLGATLGMCLMASSNHLLMVFLGVEMASLPSYALAGFLKGKRRASEASLKYVVYGGGASGIMLYGISLLAGKFQTASLPQVAAHYVLALKPMADSPLGIDPVLVLGTFFLLVGLSFKLAAVPFHFWCPDVFEGACAEVAGFLSVASKGAAMALLARVLFIFGGLDATTRPFVDQLKGPIDPNWMQVVDYLLPTIALLAVVTATFGNLAAYLQTNLKRLLAYSTIAQAGYMMMGLAVLTREAAAAVLFYLVVYLFMNLGAFAIVAFLRNQTGSEDLSSFRGLVRRSPLLVLTLAVFLLSLLGLPPLAGFPAKLQIFMQLYKGGQLYVGLGHPGLAYILYALLVIAGLNTVLSAVYYLKVLKVMILERTLEEVENRPSEPLPAPPGAALYASLLAVVVVIVGVLWNPLAAASARGVARFRESPGKPIEKAPNLAEVRP